MRKLILTLLLLVASFGGGAVYARDGWEGRPHVCDMPLGPRLEKCQAWVATVKQADNRVSCCGDGDAFITDNFEVIGEELWAIITADYPDVIGQDEEGNTFMYAASVHKGSRILIPKEKRNYAKEDAGNTSGHGVVFLRPSDSMVLCYFSPPLI